jgi:drug/metabolite transporter (DMT)-like permease
MKLNVWQWVGVLLLVVGLALYIHRYFNTPAQ